MEIYGDINVKAVNCEGAYQPTKLIKKAGVSQLSCFRMFRSEGGRIPPKIRFPAGGLEPAPQAVRGVVPYLPLLGTFGLRFAGLPFII